jgi:hypothetical protein
VPAGQLTHQSSPGRALRARAITAAMFRDRPLPSGTRWGRSLRWRVDTERRGPRGHDQAAEHDPRRRPATARRRVRRALRTVRPGTRERPPVYREREQIRLTEAAVCCAGCPRADALPHRGHQQLDQDHRRGGRAAKSRAGAPIDTTTSGVIPLAKCRLVPGAGFPGSRKTSALGYSGLWMVSRLRQ